MHVHCMCVYYTYTSGFRLGCLEQRQVVYIVASYSLFLLRSTAYRCTAAIALGHASGYSTSAMLWLLERVIIVFMHSCGDKADRVLICGVLCCCSVVQCLTGHYVSPDSKLNGHMYALVGKGPMSDRYN